MYTKTCLAAKLDLKEHVLRYKNSTSFSNVKYIAPIYKQYYVHI